MLRCTIEIVPFGWSSRLSNISDPYDGDLADYACTLLAPARLLGPGKQRAIAYVHGHRRSDGAAKLVSRAIEALDWTLNYGKPRRKNGKRKAV